MNTSLLLIMHCFYTIRQQVWFKWLGEEATLLHFVQVRKPKVKQENGFDEDDVPRSTSKLNMWWRVLSMMMIHLLSNLTIILADRVLESNTSPFATTRQPSCGYKWHDEISFLQVRTHPTVRNWMPNFLSRLQRQRTLMIYTLLKMDIEQYKKD